MSTLKERAHKDLVAAMRLRDELCVATMRMLLSAVTGEEKAGTTERELSDDEVVTVISREVKKRREAAVAYEEVGHPETAMRELAELAVLMEYLPKQLDTVEVAALVSAAIVATGAQSVRQMGLVMKELGPATAGKVDGATLSGEVKRQLGV